MYTVGDYSTSGGQQYYTTTTQTAAYGNSPTSSSQGGNNVAIGTGGGNQHYILPTDNDQIQMASRSGDDVDSPPNCISVRQKQLLL